MVNLSPEAERIRCCNCKKPVQTIKNGQNVDVAKLHYTKPEPISQANRHGKRPSRVMCKGSYRPVMVDL